MCSQDNSSLPSASKTFSSLVGAKFNVMMQQNGSGTLMEQNWAGRSNTGDSGLIVSCGIWEKYYIANFILICSQLNVPRFLEGLLQFLTSTYTSGSTNTPVLVKSNLTSF
jgi:hypothetical protein